MTPVCTEDECGRNPYAKGLCRRHYSRQWKMANGKTGTTPERNAENALRQGRQLMPPQSLPFRALARSCNRCGDLLTTPPGLLRKDAGRLPGCHRCHIRDVRNAQRSREQRDEEYRKKQRRRANRNKAKTNRATAETAGRSGYQWTGPELEIVARPDLTARQVAEMIGRSMYAVKHARQKLSDPKWAQVAGIPDART